MSGWEKRLALALLLAALALLINVWLITNGTLIGEDEVLPATRPPAQGTPPSGVRRS